MPYNPVTAASFSGAPYTAKAKAGSPVRNNGGTVLMGGNIQSGYAAGAQTPVSQVLTNAFMGIKPLGNVVPLNPLGEGVAKALSAGTFATMTAGSFIGMRYSNGAIAGIANTLLAGGAGWSARRSENSFVNPVRTQSYIMTGGWNYTTGQPIRRTDVNDTFLTETPPTMALPGRLTFMVTGSTAFLTSYKPKND